MTIPHNTPPNGQSEPPGENLTPAQARELVNDIQIGMQPTERPLKPLVAPERLNTLAKNLIRLLPAADLIRFARDLTRVAETIDHVCLGEPSPPARVSAAPSPVARPLTKLTADMLQQILDYLDEGKDLDWIAQQTGRTLASISMIRRIHRPKLVPSRT